MEETANESRSSQYEQYDLEYQNKQAEEFKVAVRDRFAITNEELREITNRATDVKGDVPSNFGCLFCKQLVFDAMICKCGSHVACEPCIRYTIG